MDNGIRNIVRKSNGDSPALAEKALNSEAAIRGMLPELRRAALAELAAAKKKLDQAVCSQAWFDQCWGEGRPFPPPAETSPMVPCCCERCRRQGRVWPAHYRVSADSGSGAMAGSPVEASINNDETVQANEAFLAYDCYLESLDDWTAAQLPSSPSGMALSAIRDGRIRLRRQRTRLGRRR